MGQSHSQNLNGSTIVPKKRASLRSPFMRRKQRSPLSAVFTAPNTNNIDALNINTATVEQLMTLPGITRQIGQSIVEHRTAIGGRFQRVDDLALVSGIGAEKLDKIRSDVCVKRKTVGSMNGSCVSSRTPSMDSVTSEPLFREQKLIMNVNKATVFQLQQINGLNQEIAANLVDYRTRKGDFRCLDDIIKVKGISHARLGAIRTHLSLSDDDLPKTPRLRHVSTFSASTPIKNGYHNNYNNINNINNNNNNRQINRKSMSMPTKMSLSLTNGFTNAPVHDIFELLGAYSHRPIVEEDYRHERNGFSTIRMTSWNLDRMCFEKSENLGVKEVICRTILENRLSILCLQEILDQSAISNICDELNSPSLKRVQEWRENSKNWKYFVNSTCKMGQINGLGFIYDADFCQLVDSDSMEISLSACVDKNDPVPPTAFLAAFKLSDWTCYVLNIYLRYFNLLNTNCVLKSIETQLENRIKNQQQLNATGTPPPTLNDVFLVAGDFSGTIYQNKEISNNNHHNHQNNAKFNLDEKQKLINTTTTVDIDLQNLGFYNIIEMGITSYNNNNSSGNSNSQTEIINNHNRPLIESSCNILCREKLPIKKIELRDVLFNNNTKTPINVNNFDINKVPLKKDKLTGHSGIISKGLCHMAIPRNWTWGGPASEHVPIWIEIYRRSNRENIEHNNHTIKTTTSTSYLLLNGERSNGTRKKLYSRSPSVGKKINSSKESLSSRKNYKISNGIGGGGGGVGSGYLINGDLNISSDSVFLTQNSDK